jgi:hypothetical protein
LSSLDHETYVQRLGRELQANHFTGSLPDWSGMSSLDYVYALAFLPLLMLSVQWKAGHKQCGHKQLHV